MHLKKKRLSSDLLFRGMPKYCNGNCPCQNFRSKNSFKSDVALKHAPDERPVRKADQKSEIAPARDEEKRRRRNRSLEHGDVPIFGVCTT